jgi:hypothetical protein
MAKHGFPPFIDASIRREPDLEHAMPAISCLCRGGAFTPRLGVGDCVAYLAVKRKYSGEDPHRRLVAVLQVKRLFDTHNDAAAWYRSRKMRLPGNCMVAGNGPLPLDMSHGRPRLMGCGAVCGDRLWKRWDAKYRERAQAHGRIAVCKPLYRNLSWEAPKVHEDQLVRVFGHVPVTQNPPAFPLEMPERLIAELGIKARPSSR